MMLCWMCEKNAEPTEGGDGLDDLDFVNEAADSFLQHVEAIAETFQDKEFVQEWIANEYANRPMSCLDCYKRKVLTYLRDLLISEL